MGIVHDAMQKEDVTNYFATHNLTCGFGSWRSDERKSVGPITHGGGQMCCESCKNSPVHLQDFNYIRVIAVILPGK